MKIKVETNAGEPNAFYLGERYVGVVAILDRWFGCDHRYFKLYASDDGDVYILRHDEPADEWEMTWFDAERDVR
jgi:hypothetical protein